MALQPKNQCCQSVNIVKLKLYVMSQSQICLFRLNVIQQGRWIGSYVSHFALLKTLVCQFWSVFYKPLMSRGLFCLTNRQWKFEDSWKMFFLRSVLFLKHLKSNFSVMFEILKANGKKEAIWRTFSGKITRKLLLV